jgi:glycosyltransferase involved in cell wall biosynthesis
VTLPDVRAGMPGAALDPDAAVAGPRKSHIMIVGHLAGEQVFGAERSLLELLAAVDRQRYVLSCVLPGRSDAYEQAVARYTTNISVFPYGWWSTARRFDPEATARFEALIRSGRVDLVHVNTITLMDPLLAARHLGVPAVVHARELISHDKGLAALFGDDPSAIVRSVRAASDFIIANSAATHRLYGTGDRSFRLYNCIDVDHFDLPNDPEPGTLKVGIISSNHPKKGIEHFVDLAIIAGRRRPELQFFVFGPRNDYVERLEERVRSEGTGARVHFPGYVADPVDAIRQVNVLVSFSLVAESFGRTIAEALAARRPVIAYRWGAAPELVRHGRDGFLVPYLDFPKALEHLGTLADHPDRLREMGRNGRERAERLFSPDVFGSTLNGIYRHIIEAWKARGHLRS